MLNHVKSPFFVGQISILLYNPISLRAVGPFPSLFEVHQVALSTWQGVGLGKSVATNVTKTWNVSTNGLVTLWVLIIHWLTILVTYIYIHMCVLPTQLTQH